MHAHQVPCKESSCTHAWLDCVVPRRNACANRSPSVSRIHTKQSLIFLAHAIRRCRPIRMPRLLISCLPSSLRHNTPGGCTSCCADAACRAELMGDAKGPVGVWRAVKGSQGTGGVTAEVTGLRLAALFACCASSPMQTQCPIFLQGASPLQEYWCHSSVPAQQNMASGVCEVNIWFIMSLGPLSLTSDAKGMHATPASSPAQQCKLPKAKPNPGHGPRHTVAVFLMLGPLI